MLKPLLNRAQDGSFSLPGDGLYHIVPKGEFPHPESKTVQVLDDRALDSITNRFAEESRDPQFTGLRVDYDHFSYANDKSSEAAGWIKGLIRKDDGIYANVHWTPQGESAVKDGRFRLASPVWLPHQVETLPGSRIRPLRLDSAGLTNNPNLRGMAPLCNRAGSVDLADIPNQKQTSMKSIANKLGLSAEASEDAILTAVTTLQNRATTLETENTAIKNRETTLKAEHQTLLTAQVDSDLKEFDGVIQPEAKEAIKAQLIANRAGTLVTLRGLKPQSASRGTNEGQFNRANGKQPGSGAGEGVHSDADKSKAAAIKNRADELKASNPGRQWNKCWHQAEQELAAKS